MSKKRNARVNTPPIEVRIATEQGRLVNISATGALVQTSTKQMVGRERPLTLKVSDESVPLKVQIVRVEFLPPAAQTAGADADSRRYGVAVTFSTELTGTAKQAVADLCGPAFTAEE